MCFAVLLSSRQLRLKIQVWSPGAKTLRSCNDHDLFCQDSEEQTGDM